MADSSSQKRRIQKKKKTKDPPKEKSGDYDYWQPCVPIIYDWIAQHKLKMPSCSCRWGPESEYSSVYISEKADDRNTLVLAEFDIVKPKVARKEHLFEFETLTPFKRISNTIVPPEEVTRIRELPQQKNIVATLGVGPKVFIWDMKAQAVGGASVYPKLALSTPLNDGDARFALAMSKSSSVLSGGKDKVVNLWDIGDHISTLGSNVDGSCLIPRETYKGHTDTVRDMQFHPTNPQEFCSVGDDGHLLFYDARVTTAKATVKIAHGEPIQCVDWGKNDEHYILTGSADHSVYMTDRRKVHTHLRKFEEHTDPVFCVQWCPNQHSVFGSSAGRILNIWDYEKDGNGLLFKHCGHRDKVVDFHWNVSYPRTLVSLSNNVRNGAMMQFWRWRSDLFEEDEV